MSKKSSTTATNVPMTGSAAARIQAGTAVHNGGKVSRGSFAARAQRAAAHNTNSGKK